MERDRDRDSPKAPREDEALDERRTEHERAPGIESKLEESSPGLESKLGGDGRGLEDKLDAPREESRSPLDRSDSHLGRSSAPDLESKLGEALRNQERLRDRADLEQTRLIADLVKFDDREHDLLQPEQWNKLYASQRLEVLDRVEEVLARQHGREKQPVAKWPADGQFDGMSVAQIKEELEKPENGFEARFSTTHGIELKDYYIDPSITNGQGEVLAQDPRNAVEQLAHESRHAFQVHLMREFEEKGSGADLRGVSHETVKQWVSAGPVPDSFDDPLGYENHPLERDARAFAREFNRRLYGDR